MARIIKLPRQPANGDVTSQANDSARAGAADEDRVQATITQALYMVRMYAEILAMDEVIIKRIQDLVGVQSEDSDREDSLKNMRLVIVQLEKIGKRIAHWNARLRALLKEELGTAVSRPRSTGDL
jgi:hypothetical protein